MGVTSSPESEFSETIREHVLSPLETAQRRVEREYREVKAERRAFNKFKDRISGIDTATTHSSQSVPVTHSVDTLGRRSVKRVRRAFRATVMSVDHYDDVYGESLDEHAAAELSPDIATLFQDSQATEFTEPAKVVLTSAVNRAVDRRDIILKTLGREQDSLDENRNTIIDLLDEYDGSGISERCRHEIKDELDALAGSRQETLKHHPPMARADGHDLCDYLYEGHEWTYPVLTAITRFRRVLV